MRGRRFAKRSVDERCRKMSENACRRHNSSTIVAAVVLDGKHVASNLTLQLDTMSGDSSYARRVRLVLRGRNSWPGRLRQVGGQI